MRRLTSVVSILSVVLGAAFAASSVLFAQTPTPIFINEIHYDNAGTDSGEGFEVAGPAGTDLAGWTMVLYNGSNSEPYNTVNLTGMIPDQDNGFGTLPFFVAGIQNGAPDGLALVNASSTVVQFLSYEGAITAATGAAAGLTSANIGVTEGSSTPVGSSLQLGGTGNTYEDFVWAVAAANTFGAINSGQSFGGGGGDAAPSVSSTTPDNGASDVAIDANIDIVFSEDVTVAGTWFAIDCSASGPHTAAVGGGPASYTLDPDADFVEGEMCTVTIVAAQVTDVDTDDPPDAISTDVALTFTTAAPVGGSGWIINELLADPAADLPGDANGDGTREATQDEFVELVNNTGAAVDISGWTIADGNSVRHTFEAGTVVANQCAALVFGGGNPTGIFGNAVVQTASTGALGLNNGGDSIVIDGGGLVQASTNYGGEGGNNQSLTLEPDITGAAYVQHSTAAASAGALFSPGTQIDGSQFAGCDAAPMAAPELLLTEIRVTPTEGEFVEIYNPTGATIDLANVYLTDGTFAGGSTYYYNLVTGTNAGGGGFGDFNARFPAGATIPAGAYQTIALAGSANFVTTYGMAPTYELFDDGSVDGEQPMIEATSGSIDTAGSGLSNSGEVVILYYWDGNSDLVADLDYAVWGDKVEAVDKTGIALDGPDADADSSAFQADTPIATQDVIAGGSHGSDDSWQRDDLAEGAEVQSGGNGTNGSNETSEDLSNTWCAATPTPNAESGCAPTGGTLGFCADPATAIHSIQGSGSVFDPAFGGTQVIEGVVVASFEGLRGFYVQEEPNQVDGDAATSEGIFVFVNGTPTAQVGNVVRVLGDVGEYVTTAASQTQLTGAIQVLDCGVAPETDIVTPTELTLPVAALDDFERYEGMLVRFSQELVISEYFNFDRFGEMVLALPLDGQDRPFQPTSVTTPGAAANALQAEIARRRITLDDGRTAQNPDPALHPNGNIFDLANLFRGGDTVTGAVGVIDQTFALYRIQPTAAPIYTATNPRTPAPEDVGGSLTVASFNVLNYFTTLDDGSSICGPNGNLGCRGADANQPDEFTRQRAKIIDALVRIDADIVGLVEIENNATEAVQDLVDGINVIAGAGTYTFVDTGTIGTDAIKVAFIYKPATVSLAGAHAILDSSVDPLFIDTKNRPALAQTFEELATGAKFTAVINHLKSKGSACDDVGDPDMNDGQANCNQTRTNAATALANWLATDPTGSGDPDFMILGDLNAYAMEDPIVALEAGGYTNLIKLFQGEFAYSFVFSGVYGYLDHALANGSLLGQVSGVAEWHINADEPDILDYDTSFKQDAQDALYEPNAYRSSDHDPVVVGLNLTSPEPERTRINSLLKLKRLRARYNPHPVENAPKGVLTIRARFTNRSDSTIQDIQFEVARLTRNNLLLNADGGPAGQGATLTIAADALGSDGVLSPKERFVVEFEIGLQSRRPFRFAVNATGVVLDGTMAAMDDNAEEFELDVIETEFEAGRENAIFLPLLHK